MANIHSNIEMGELSYQKQFYSTFYGKDWRDKVNYDRNTDGYTKDLFFEHKENAQEYGI